MCFVYIVGCMAWHVINCWGTLEHRVTRDLIRHGFDAFCPSHVLRKRVKKPGQHKYELTLVTEPMFAGYIFADVDDYAFAKTIPGYIGPINAGPDPIVIPPRVLAALRALTTTVPSKGGSIFDGCEGKSFRFTKGHSLAGFTAMIESVANADVTGSITAWVNLLGSDRLVTVSCEVIEEIINPAQAA